MKVMVDGQQEQIINATVQELNAWWISATASVFKEGRLIYCVEIDGQQIFNGYDQFMINNIDNIQTINIATLSRMESIQETEQSLDEYLGRFVKGSMEISEHFYGQLNDEHWQQFSDFIIGLNWIVKSLEFLIELYKQEEVQMPNFLSVFNEIESCISELENALEQKDYVTVGDLIQYEIIPALQKYQNRSKTKEN